MAARLALLPFLAAAVLLLAADRAVGDCVARYRVILSQGDSADLIRLLEREGIDVAGSNRNARSVEAIVSASQLRQLHAMGLAPSVTGPVGRSLPAGYRELGAIRAAMIECQRCCPAIAMVVDVGRTFGAGATLEGRPLLAMKISDNVACDEDEPAVLIVACHHAREIITPELALHYIAELVAGYGTDPEITRWVNDNEIWIAPVWNPDGLAHCRAADESWRKNRRPYAGACGVDLNRNYPCGWSGPYAGSDRPGSTTYKGPSPASEEETRAMMAWALDRRFAKCLDLHSYGREVVFGYYSADSLPPGIANWLAVKGSELSAALGYDGWIRRPSAEGEHHQWELNELGGFAFLVEAGDSFQPPHGEALSEAALTWPGIRWFLDHEIPLKGHVLEAGTGTPLAADIDIAGICYPENDIRRSGGRYGRFHYFLPPGAYEATVSAPGYEPRRVAVTIEAGRSTTFETQLGAAPALTVAGIAAPGRTLELILEWPEGAGQHFAAGMSWSDEGFVFPNGLVFPLGLTGLLRSTAGRLPGWSGTLDSQGRAAAALPIPAAFGGQTFYMAYFTYADDWRAPTASSAAVRLAVE